MDIKNKNTTKIIPESGTNTEHMGTVRENKEKEMKDLVNDMKEFF